ncbi:dihydropteroate synthase [Nocardioides dongxiaopingii]|uniref:dihydropteroate synthase n=1 Tax=Nocardioides sp. S-1144 TaxID=2582905 RepID=UPI00116455C1|nr:dihydropteroate synthase [Nocardioides sp. S-1144]QDH11125.1 dihydropteroate synthase [Nocardioides sp. S-1144]
MIRLADLARLAAEHADDLAALDRPIAPLEVAGRSFDTDVRPAVMGVVNLSRDSTYRESVVTSSESALRRARVLVAQGADFVDLGAESSDATSVRVDAAEQAARLTPLIRELAAEGVLVSIESYEPAAVRAGLEAGARIVNLTGSAHDAAMFDLAAAHGAAVVLCHVLGPHARDLDPAAAGPSSDPLAGMLDGFARRIDDARARGVTALVVDPGAGFGFSLGDQRARVRHQARMLVQSFRLRSLGVPVCHSVPHSFELFEEQFRTAEGFFTVLAHLGGTGVYRTHEVPHVVAVLGALDALDVD